jgi:hypothetical protein
MRFVRIDQQLRIIRSFFGPVRARAPQWPGHQSITVHGSSLRSRALRGQAPDAPAAIEQNKSQESVFRDKSVGDTIRDFRI